MSGKSQRIRVNEEPKITMLDGDEGNQVVQDKSSIFERETKTHPEGRFPENEATQPWRENSSMIVRIPKSNPYATRGKKNNIWIFQALECRDD